MLEQSHRSPTAKLVLTPTVSFYYYIILCYYYYYYYYYYYIGHSLSETRCFILATPSSVVVTKVLGFIRHFFNVVRRSVF